MAKTKTQSSPEKLTPRPLNVEFERLKTRVEDLEDLRDLNEAIGRNAGKPGTPWSDVKRELGLERSSSRPTSAEQLKLLPRSPSSPHLRPLAVNLGNLVLRAPRELCSPRVAQASTPQRLVAKLSPGGYGINWPLIDEDISIASLLRERTKPECDRYRRS